jgi:hypothetical protein
MIRPPSLQKPFDLVSALDQALDRPERGDAQSDADWEAVEKGWEERLRVARETGQWADLIRPGHAPTTFTVKPLAGSVLRLLQDDINAGRIGGQEAHGLVVRLCLQSIGNAPEPFKIELEGHGRYGKLAKASLVDYLDSINPVLILELGNVLILRGAIPPGK